jgi:hypothetical protein
MRSSPLPRFVLGLFWDCDSSQIGWETHKDFIIKRVLVAGGWEAIRWLRSLLGDSGLRQWLIQRKGRGLDPRQLRFWQLALRIDSEEVDSWIAATANNPWRQRLHPRHNQIQ